jgi:hypothetical protein
MATIKPYIPVNYRASNGYRQIAHIQRAEKMDHRLYRVRVGNLFFDSPENRWGYKRDAKLDPFLKLLQRRIINEPSKPITFI